MLNGRSDDHREIGEIIEIYIFRKNKLVFNYDKAKQILNRTIS